MCPELTTKVDLPYIRSFCGEVAVADNEEG